MTGVLIVLLLLTVLVALSAVANYKCAALTLASLNRLYDSLGQVMLDLDVLQEEVQHAARADRAEVLLEAALAYETVEELGHRKRLSWTDQPPEEDKPMMVLWLRDRAARMREGYK